MLRRDFLALAGTALTPQSAPRSTVVWRAATDGYHTYRIPALIATRGGVLLAFCEGRKDSRSDAGNIDLIVKRSRDNGLTWSTQSVIADFGTDTIGNPCPVEDKTTGVIWLLLTRNPGHLTEREIEKDASKGTRTVWVTHSRDGGETWAAPIDITASTKDPGWGWYATGPGNGIQTRSGRLVIPCDHRRFVGQERHSHIIYSDDHGETWKLGGSANRDTNECAVAELADGSLLLNMRSYHGLNRRYVARSEDGGLTWSYGSLDPELIEPVCQASLISFDKRYLIFSNPASTRRERLTVRVSADDGNSWPHHRVLHEGPAAYSSLAALPNRQIGCLYECGDANAYETITFAAFSLPWLTSSTT